MPNKYFNIFKDLVIKKGGLVISLESDYINSHYNLDVKCNDNHLFKICLNNIKKIDGVLIVRLEKWKDIQKN